MDDENVNQNDNQQTPLPEDNDTPFSPPTSPVDDTSDDLAVKQEQQALDPTHQALDSATNIDSHQAYDEGLGAAAEASEPNAGNTVVDYDPDKAEE